jgi:hypothetical protein
MEIWRELYRSRRGGRSLQRETLADLLKDESLEVIECTSAEAAELVVAVSPLDIPKMLGFC